MTQVSGQNPPTYERSTASLNNQASVAFSQPDNTSLEIVKGISAFGRDIDFNTDEYTVVFFRYMQFNAPWTLFSTPGVVLRAGSLHSKFGPALTDSQLAAYPPPPSASCMQAVEIVENGSAWDVKYRYGAGALVTAGTQITIRNSSAAEETCYLGSDWCNFNDTALGNQPSSMNIGELLFFSGALDDAQLTKIYNQFKSKYNL